LYVEVAADMSIVATRTVAESVLIEANLRHGELEQLFNERTLESGDVAHALGGELQILWRFAQYLQIARGKADEAENQRTEYNFYVADERIEIVERLRGSPVDKIVSELMIYANAEWGGQLAKAEYPAIYRAQSNGTARMTTAPSRHDGLGVAQYAWSSSPLRRYVDLINQRQLLALVGGQAPVYRPSDESLLAALRDFEVAYDAYAEFQRNMERYWCLRWIEQENAWVQTATVLRDNLVRFNRLPIVMRVPSLHDVKSGDQVSLAISKVDLWELSLHAEFESLVSVF
jgi:exoribonuclease-2